jgi:hypothetical protein
MSAIADRLLELGLVLPPPMPAPPGVVLPFSPVIVRGWTRVFGMVNAAPGFVSLPSVINGCSDLIFEVFGAEVGAHARSAVGLAELPFSIPVEIECEVEIR